MVLRDRLSLLWVAAAAVVSVPTIDAGAQQAIDFGRDVKPILSRHCVSCHGGVKQAGDLSFVYEQQVLGPEASRRGIIVPTEPDDSELILRVTSNDPDYRMPPPEESAHGLSDQEKATLTAWVKSGAVWNSHWAFEVPQRHPQPQVGDEDWTRQPIDSFVLSRLESEGLRPAKDAAPDIWLRRVSLALVGLPPTPQDRLEFLERVKRDGQAAYEAKVDELLASPLFGERWASVWLDQIRYADSKGLGWDRRRQSWKYRDWVIESFNQDLPYDKFTVQQIAGDLLPNATMDDLIATTAHRLTATNDEGGTDDEQFRVEAVVDRVNTVGQAWQAVTIGCAQCHDHPYDPIRHEEYYKFMALFNNSQDTDLESDEPLLAVPLDTADYQRAREMDRRINELKQTVWAPGYALLTSPAIWTGLSGLTATTNNETQVTVERHEDRDEYHTVGTVSQDTLVTLEAPLPDGVDRLTAIRINIMPLDPETAVKDSEHGFVLSHIKAELIEDGTEPRLIELSRVIGDEADPVNDPMDSLNERSPRGYSAMSRIYQPRAAAVVLAEPLDIPAGAKLRVSLDHKVFLQGAYPLVSRRGSLGVTSDPRFTALDSDDDLASQEDELASLNSERRRIRSVRMPIMGERPEQLRRNTYVFARGNYLSKEDQVEPGVPAELFTSGGRDVSNRLELAEWLVADTNPLTARVAVNRFWARMFGVGLVATEEDFGSSGDAPSHPQLLDDLTVRFKNDMGWSVKSLLREIALSRTFRQSEAYRPELADVDSENRLLARGPRFRMPAEMVRDQALAVSGLISGKMFGESVQPPIPDGVWKPFDSERWRTPDTDDEDRYRRSIYTYAKRSIPFPMFAAFDAPSREFCTSRRLRSNTPLQALMTLNDVTFSEASAAFASNLLAMGGTDRERMAHGFVAVTGREPSEAEIDELISLLGNASAILGAEKAAEQNAEQDPDQAAPDSGDAEIRQRAMTEVARVLLNLDEIMYQ